ncbi:sensor domain-containing diguanylate cyclase [Vibrio sp.]|nr:sensor domain-containing diguanylate cyclase [Vibrio sp.]
MQNILDMEAFDDFESLSTAVLEYLSKKIDFGLWMMTRTSGHDWIVLQANATKYDVKRGDVFQWSDSFCSRMVKGEGPRVVPDVADTPVYLEAPIGRKVDIKAYIGVPICDDKGELFGTLCAIDPDVQDEKIRNDIELVELMGRLMGTVLANEMRMMTYKRRLEQSRREAMTDVMTKVLNRRGWEEALHTEETRAQQLGNHVGIMIIDLDDLKVVNDTKGHEEGDKCIVQAAEILKHCVFQKDIIARLGGDEFGIIVFDGNTKELNQLANDITLESHKRGIHLSIGIAERAPQHGLKQAICQADTAMYENKLLRKKSRH